jgi:hypothetical protein
MFLLVEGTLNEAVSILSQRNSSAGSSLKLDFWFKLLEETLFMVESARSECFLPIHRPLIIVFTDLEFIFIGLTFHDKRRFHKIVRGTGIDLFSPNNIINFFGV